MNLVYSILLFSGVAQAAVIAVSAGTGSLPLPPAPARNHSVAIPAPTIDATPNTYFCFESVSAFSTTHGLREHCQTRLPFTVTPNSSVADLYLVCCVHK